MRYRSVAVGLSLLCAFRCASAINEDVEWGLSTRIFNITNSQAGSVTVVRLSPPSPDGTVNAGMHFTGGPSWGGCSYSHEMISASEMSITIFDASGNTGTKCDCMVDIVIPPLDMVVLEGPVEVKATGSQTDGSEMHFSFSEELPVEIMQGAQIDIEGGWTYVEALCGKKIHKIAAHGEYLVWFNVCDVQDLTFTDGGFNGFVGYTAWEDLFGAGSDKPVIRLRSSWKRVTVDVKVPDMGADKSLIQLVKNDPTGNVAFSMDTASVEGTDNIDESHLRLEYGPFGQDRGERIYIGSPVENTMGGFPKKSGSVVFGLAKMMGVAAVMLMMLAMP